MPDYVSEQLHWNVPEEMTGWALPSPGQEKLASGACGRAQLLQEDPGPKGHCQEDEKLPIKPRPTWPHWSKYNKEESEKSDKKKTQLRWGTKYNHLLWEMRSKKGMLDVQRTKCRNDKKYENKDKMRTSIPHGPQSNDGSSRRHQSPQTTACSSPPPTWQSISLVLKKKKIPAISHWILLAGMKKSRGSGEKSLAKKAMQTGGGSKIIKGEGLWGVPGSLWCLPSLNLEGKMEGLAMRL